MSFASPRAVLNALLPGPEVPAANAAEAGGSRVAAFKRFIADLESRGGGEAISVDFPAGADWLNVPGPLSLKKELKGKVLILDFWTSCCINCLHILPDLRFLERKYEGRAVAVVGVHSAKFDSEKDTAVIRSAVIKDEVQHPVVNDKAMSMWKALGVSAWPTLVVVSPRGRILARISGEGHREDMDDLVAAALEYYGEKGLLDQTPVPSLLEKDRDARLSQSPFRFPGKVATDPAGGRIFVADSSNHRILLLDDAGKFLGQVGGNGSGLRDGNLEDCAFNRPQGLAYDAATDTLFVADVENHAVRAVDLMNGVVTTLAGTGQKGSDYKGGRWGAQQPLNSPWDVVLDPTNRDNVLVAMAGTHQVWRFSLKDKVAGLLSGNGYERNLNGNSPSSTAWAQPSGLAASADGKEVYVADAESSSIRALNLSTGGSRLLAGGDPLFADNLFRFGDRDGFGSDALLQHPLGVATLPSEPGKVFFVDSYNHRVKVLDLSTQEATSLAGSGKPGFADGVGTSAGFAEPGGLCAGPRPGTLLVADTNNNVLRLVDVNSGAVSTIEPKGVPAPRVDPGVSILDDLTTPPVPAGATVVSTPAVTAAAGRLRLNVQLPSGYHFTPGTTPAFETKLVGATDQSWLKLSATSGVLKEGEPIDIQFERTAAKVDLQAKGAPLLLRTIAKIYFCKDNDVCLQELVVFDTPFETKTETGGAVGGEVELTAQLKAA